MVVLACTLFFICGLGVGFLSKGITISHHHYEKLTTPQKEGYNESMAKLLPNDVQEYYTSNNGFNKF